MTLEQRALLARHPWLILVLCASTVLCPPLVHSQERDVSPLVQEFANQKESIASRVAAGRGLEAPGRVPIRFVPKITAIALNSRENSEVRQIAMQILASENSDGSSALYGLSSVLADRTQPLAVRSEAVRTVGAIAGAAQVSLPVDKLVGVLRDRTDSLDLRVEVVRSLEAMHQAGRKAIPALIQIAADRTEPFALRLGGIEALQQIAQGAHAALIEMETIFTSANENVNLRMKAAQAMGPIGVDAEAVRDLMAVLKDRSANLDLRRAAILPLVSQQPAATAAASTLEGILRDSNEDVQLRSRAAQALGMMRIASDQDIAAVIRILGSDHEPTELRERAADYAGTLGSRASSVAPTLAQLLANQNEDLVLRRFAVSALGMIRRNGLGVLANLDTVVQNRGSDLELRRRATWAIGAIGADDKSTDQQIIPILIEVLKHSERSSNDPQMRQYAVSFLGNMDPGSSDLVHILSETAKNVNEHSEIRRDAASALGRIGSNYDAASAAPVLAMILEDSGESLQLRQAAAESLVKVRPGSLTTAHALVGVLTNRQEDPRLRSSAAVALRTIGVEAPFIASALANVLRDKSEAPDLRAVAAQALGNQGGAAEPYLSLLFKGLDDPNINVNAAVGLSRFAQIASAEGATDSINILKKAEIALEIRPGLRSAAPPGGESFLVTIRQARASLELQSFSKEKEKLWAFVYAHLWVVLLVAVVALWYLVTAILLLFRPLWLLKPSEYFSDSHIILRISKARIPLEYFPIYLFPRYHLRILDSWVRHHADTARKNFAELSTVSERTIRVDLPVRIDSNLLQNLTPRDLRRIFNRKRACVLISGEGGAGKTTLACQIGKWSLADDPENRICDHIVLPILVEGDINPTSGSGSDLLPEIVRGKLRDFLGIGESPSRAMVASLLRSRRILVIVDGLSEMRIEARQTLQTESPTSPINALVVTSRLDERLQASGQTLLAPQKLDRSVLVHFVEEYLRGRHRLGLFPGDGFLKLCVGLKATISNRDITPLFAKLYLEDAIESVDAGIAFSFERGNIPRLVLTYLNNLNRNVSSARLDDVDVHRAAEIVAWECLKERLRPLPAKIAAVRSALEEVGVARTALDYLRTQLRLVETVSLGEEIRFVHDTFAEYLAALHLIEQNDCSDSKWSDFLSRADEDPDSPGTIRGFLMAVRDCYAYRYGEGLVTTEISRCLAGE